jgi:hypothetical protein
VESEEKVKVKVEMELWIVLASVTFELVSSSTWYCLYLYRLSVEDPIDFLGSV